jgi:hypothetical protein
LYRYEGGWSTPVETTFFGLSNQPVKSTGGYHKETQKLDDYGRVVEIKVFNTDGAPVDSHGYCRTTMGYDNYGHLIAAAYFAANGSRALNGNIHRWVAHYDERGRQTEKMWYGLDDRPATEIYAKAKMKYDMRGNLINKTFFDEKDEARGGTTWKYDAIGNAIEETYFGSYSAEDGIARILRTFDSYRRVIEERRIDSQYRVVRVTTNVYDSRGKKIYVAHKGAGGHPMLGPSPTARDCAVWRAQYNDEGKILKSTCEPVSSAVGSGS